MASRRMITSDIWRDRWYGKLRFMEQALWIGLFSKCADDQGRLIDDAVLIRSDLWPYQDVPIKDIDDALELFSDSGKIIRYEVNGECLIQIVNWWEHQRPQWAATSKFSPPEGWQDRIRTRVNDKYIEINWSPECPKDAPQDVQVNSSPEQFEQDLRPKPHVPVPIHVPVPVSIPVSVNKDNDLDISTVAKRMGDMLGISEGNRDHLLENIDEYGLEEVSIALEEAFIQHAYNWRYIDKVLSNRKAGIAPPGKRNGSIKPATQHVDNIGNRWT